MSTSTVLRWGGVLLILTAALFAAGGILAVLQPEGLAVALLYYLGTIVAVLGVITLYGAQREEMGRLGFAGALLGAVGAVLYSGPQLALLAGASGAAGWHDVWGFAMSNVLLAGPTAFFIGLILLGVATWRGGVLPRGSGLLLAVGAFVWLVAYFLSVVPGLLTTASLVTAGGLAWAGAALAMDRLESLARPQRAF